MSYRETEKEITALRNRYGEVLFRMAISHLMDVGTRHLTPENVEETCEEIMKQDDSRSFMTNLFQCDIVRCAGELAKLDHIHLLVYIQRNMVYDVGDDVFLSEWPKKLWNLSCWFLDDVDTRSAYGELSGAGFHNGDICLMGCGYCIPEEYEEEEPARV